MKTFLHVDAFEKFSERSNNRAKAINFHLILDFQLKFITNNKFAETGERSDFFHLAANGFNVQASKWMRINPVITLFFICTIH